MGGQFSLIHWVVVILVLLLLFGPSKIESLGRSLGRAIRGFKEGMNEVDAVAREAEEPPPQLDRKASELEQNSVSSSNKDKAPTSES